MRVSGTCSKFHVSKHRLKHNSAFWQNPIYPKDQNMEKSPSVSTIYYGTLRDVTKTAVATSK